MIFEVYVSVKDANNKLFGQYEKQTLTLESPFNADKTLKDVISKVKELDKKYKKL